MGVTDIPVSSTAVLPPSDRSSTPRVLVWAVSVLGAITLLAASYKNAVEAVAEAKRATVKALAAEPVTEASYNELSKRLEQATDQLKATQSELARLAEYVRTLPVAQSSVASGRSELGAPTVSPPKGGGIEQRPGSATPRTEPARPSASATSNLPTALPTTIVTPNELALRTKSIEARPIAKPVPFSVLKSQVKVATPP